MFIFFAILGIILTALPYMLVPILYRQAEGQIKYKNAMYFALVNSIVVSILLNIIGAGLAFLSGVAELFTVNLAPPVIYFFINKAILNMRSSRCNSYQSFLNSKEYYKTEKRLKNFFQSYDFLKSRSDNISGHGLAHRSFNYLKSIEQNLSEDQYVFVQTMALEKHFSLYKRLTAYNTVYDADLIQVFIEESKPHVAKTVEDISEYLTERMSENDSGEPTGIAIDMETYKKLKSVFEENMLYFSEIDTGKHLFKLFKIQLESEKKNDEEQQTAAEETERETETVEEETVKIEDKAEIAEKENEREDVYPVTIPNTDPFKDLKFLLKEALDEEFYISNIKNNPEKRISFFNELDNEIDRLLTSCKDKYDDKSQILRCDAILLNVLANECTHSNTCAINYCYKNKGSLQRKFVNIIEYLKNNVHVSQKRSGNTVIVSHSVNTADLYLEIGKLIEKSPQKVLGAEFTPRTRWEEFLDCISKSQSTETPEKIKEEKQKEEEPMTPGIFEKDHLFHCPINPIWASTNAKFLNNVFGTHYKQFQNALFRHESGLHVWMVPFNVVTEDSWINRRLDCDETIHETYVGTGWVSRIRSTRLAVAKEGKGAGRRYIILGVYKFSGVYEDDPRTYVYRRIPHDEAALLIPQAFKVCKESASSFDPERTMLDEIKNVGVRVRYNGTIGCNIGTVTEASGNSITVRFDDGMIKTFILPDHLEFLKIVKQDPSQSKSQIIFQETKSQIKSERKNIFKEKSKTMKAGEYIVARTHAEFLNQLYGSNLKAFFKSSISLPDGRIIWMIRLGNFVSPAGFVNCITSENTISEKFVGGDPTFKNQGTYYSAIERGIEPRCEDRVTFDIVEIPTFDRAKIRKYVFRGVYQLNIQESSYEENVWERIMDEYSF